MTMSLGIRQFCRSVFVLVSLSCNHEVQAHCIAGKSELQVQVVDAVCTIYFGLLRRYNPQKC